MAGRLIIRRAIRRGGASATTTITNFANIGATSTGARRGEICSVCKPLRHRHRGHGLCDGGCRPLQKARPVLQLHSIHAINEIRAFEAVGGTAVAITTISNSGAINAYPRQLGAAGDGIDGFAAANAMAISAGSYAIPFHAWHRQRRPCHCAGDHHDNTGPATSRPITATASTAAPTPIPMRSASTRPAGIRPRPP